MNKPLLISLVTATLLASSASGSMFERFEAMENEMKSLKQEIATLKAQKVTTDTDEEVEDATKAESEDEEESEEKESEDSKDDVDDEEKDTEDEEIDVKEELADLEDSISDLNRATSGNHLKFSVDYRFAIENLNYKMADNSKVSNDAFMTNRFWLNMNWSASKNLSFRAQMAYNKAFGARSGASNPQNSSFETFDWIANENAYDDIVRVRSVYFLYRNDTFLGTEVPWTFSVGRRPSTNGHLISYRDDDKAASPMAHTINVEFDGLSSKFSFDKFVEGMYIKFCAGRGMSNAAPKFTATPYTDVNSAQGANPNIDLGGLIFVPYDNGQYSLSTQYYYANNLIDMTDPQAQDQTLGFTTVGGMHSTTANFVINGIGNEWSDFLDDTIFFVSGAWSVTNPEDGQNMLGGENGERLNGYSGWVGLQIPSLLSEDGRWGFEYNQGSQYWRSITYAEDTNIGSKIAARGSAYEAYFTENLVEDILSLQIRYTYIDYDYTGSNGFFGNTSGNSMKISDIQAAAAAGNAQSIAMLPNIVDTAQDIRFYLRYKY